LRETVSMQQIGLPQLLGHLVQLQDRDLAAFPVLLLLLLRPDPFRSLSKGLRVLDFYPLEEVVHPLYAGHRGDPISVFESEQTPLLHRPLKREREREKVRRRRRESERTEKE
jgi:hypothetical protein